MPEEEPGKNIEESKFVEPKDDGGFVVDNVVPEKAVEPTQEIGALKQEMEKGFEVDYMKALDISMVRQKLEESPEKKYEVEFVLDSRDGKSIATFKAIYKLDRSYVNFTIKAFSSSKERNVSGTYEYSGKQQKLGVFADMDEHLIKEGFYGKLMDAVLQGVDVTENFIQNEEVADAHKKYGEGDYIVPSVFAKEAQMVSARKGFLCFITMKSRKGQEGMYFVGVRMPDELKNILVAAKEWERANCQLEGFDPLVEAKKMEEYMQSHQEELAEAYGFYATECKELLDMQIERFKEVAAGINRYLPKKEEKPAPQPKPWWRWW